MGKVSFELQLCTHKKKSYQSSPITDVFSGIQIITEKRMSVCEPQHNAGKGTTREASTPVDTRLNDKYCVYLKTSRLARVAASQKRRLSRLSLALFFQF